MPLKWLAVAGVVILGRITFFSVQAAQPSHPDLERGLSQNVRPFLNRYCMGCHSGTTPAAQFDLKPYTSLQTVVRDYPRWTQVLERLSAKEMPPKMAPQPPAEAR